MYKEAEYYLNKFDNGEILTEQECLDMAYEFDIKNNYGENRRWSRMVETICDLNGRYFRVFWDQGLTELECDACYEQPVEVFPTEEQRLITFIKWRDKENNIVCETMNDEKFRYCNSSI